MGFIELSKHLKASQFAWHGLCKGLDAALASEEPREQMAALLLKNLYVDDEGEPLTDEAGAPDESALAGAHWLVEYLLAQKEHLASLPSEEVLKGRLSWLPPPKRAAE